MPSQPILHYRVSGTNTNFYYSRQCVYAMLCAVLGCHTYEALNAVGVIKFAGGAYSRVSLYTADTYRYIGQL